jgi:raffinose/stachyose/melibiose transport system substrate-binding protein
VLDDTEVAKWVETGNVPIVKGADAKFGSGLDADFLKFVYGVSSNAKTFAQSWDQALSPTAAEKLLDNIAKLFQLSVTPQQWVDNMNQVIGK